MRKERKKTHKGQKHRAVPHTSISHMKESMEVNRLSRRSTPKNKLITWSLGQQVDDQRQRDLIICLEHPVNVEKGIYPFSDITPKLTRSDIMWLLTVHENGRGPIDFEDNHHRYGRKGLDLRGADLRSVDLSGLPLAFMIGGLTKEEHPNAKSEHYEAAAVHLENACLEETDLRGAVLDHAHFEGAHLSRALLDWSELRGTHFEGAHLVQTFLCCSDLYQAHLQNADLSQAHLEGIEGIQRTILHGAYLDNADMSDAHLEDTHLYQASMRNCKLERASLKNAYAVDIHLEGSDLSRANLENAALSGVHLQGTDLSYIHAEKVDFRRVHLEGANLEGARLERANLFMAYMEGTNLQKAIFTDADLRQAQLAGADLRMAHLEGTDLRAVHLEGKTLTGVDLAHMQQWDRRKQRENGILRPADLRGAFLSAGTNLENIIFGERDKDSAMLADLHWSDANLAVVNWSCITVLGDESRLRHWKKYRKKEQFLYPMLDDYRQAVRANRQLAVALQGQGLIEEAVRFAHHAQQLQRHVFLLQKSYGRASLSFLLDLVVGHGYRLRRTLGWYIGINLLCSIAYFLFGGMHGLRFPCSTPPPYGIDYTCTRIEVDWWSFLPALFQAFASSLTAFHGRGFFPEQFGQSDPRIYIAAFEAVVGLFIEACVVAGFTQRFIGK